MELCEDCKEVKCKNPHPEFEGKVICAACDNKRYYKDIREGIIVQIEIDTRKIPKWFIEKIKYDIKNFNNIQNGS